MHIGFQRPQGCCHGNMLMLKMGLCSHRHGDLLGLLISRVADQHGHVEHGHTQLLGRRQGWAAKRTIALGWWGFGHFEQTPWWRIFTAVSSMGFPLSHNNIFFYSNNIKLAIPESTFYLRLFCLVYIYFYYTNRMSVFLSFQIKCDLSSTLLYCTAGIKYCNGCKKETT